MIITRRHLSRRTVLKGLGTTLALPLLDAMVPALTPVVETAAVPVRRIGFVYLPQGANMAAWKVSGLGRSFQWSPTLTSLAPHRDQVLILSGLDHREADARGEGEGDHARASAVWLTGAHAARAEGEGIHSGVSIDQVIAARIAGTTPVPSLELALERQDQTIGACDSGYSCTYQHTISWRDAGTPLPMEIRPRAVFARLFGQEGSFAAEQAERAVQRSILDSIVDELHAFTGTLGAVDRRTLDDFTETVREVERRIQSAEAHAAEEVMADAPARPVDVPVAYADHARLMFDLLLLAYRADLTRVASFMLARELSVRSYPEIGVPDPHHFVSHHQGKPEKLADLAKINAFHVGLFAGFVDRMAATPDGDGSMLDHTLLLLGSGISESNLHYHYDLPTVLVGGGAGQVTGGRHLAFGGKPMSNLLLTLADRMAVPGIDRIGDSTGRLNIDA